jgi:hypothetical protein
MSEPLRLLPPRVAFVDPKTGMMTRDWYMFFQGLYERVGGATAASIGDLTTDLFEDAGTSEVTALLGTLSDAMQQCPQPEQPVPQNMLLFENQDLCSQVAELTKAVDGAYTDIGQLASRIAELLKELDALKQAVQS